MSLNRVIDIICHMNDFDRIFFTWDWYFQSVPWIWHQIQATLLHWYDILSQMNRRNAEQFGAICLLLAFISCETWCKMGNFFFSLEQCKSLWLYSLVFLLLLCTMYHFHSRWIDYVLFSFNAICIHVCVCNRQQYFKICASACRCVTFKRCKAKASIACIFRIRKSRIYHSFLI